MSSAELNADDRPVLELPAAVLAPKPLSALGLPRRFGRKNEDQTTATKPDVKKAAEADEIAPADQVSSHLKLVVIFVCTAFVFQLLLLVPQLQGFRMPIRMFPFTASILLVFFAPKRHKTLQRWHPAIGPAIAVIVILIFGLLNAETDSLLAGIATIAFSASILAPLFWAGRLQVGERGFVTVVRCLWLFGTASSLVGVLQVLYPGQFSGAVNQITQENEDRGITLKITLDDGTEMYRPFGLTDQPGGAAGSGVVAFTFGIGLLATTRRFWLIVLYAAGMGAGLFVIYLSQVRVALVTCGITTITFLSLLSARRQVAALTQVSVALGLVVFISTTAAFAIGGRTVTDRLFTLVQDNAQDVYYENRGHFLDFTFNYVLPEWPLGAGLGRYGMMALYFANDKGDSAHSLWAEIQWTAWAYDGGWLMVLTYPIGILLALWTTITIAFDRELGDLTLWGIILASYNISAIAITFSFPLFLSQSGLEFWLLNALIYSAYQIERLRRKRIIPAGFESAPTVWQPGIKAR